MIKYSDLSRLQDLDILVGAVAFVVLSSNHTVVSPEKNNTTLSGGRFASDVSLKLASNCIYFLKCRNDKGQSDTFNEENGNIQNSE